MKNNVMSSHDSDSKIKTKIVNGEEVYSFDDIAVLIAEQIGKMPRETRPQVLMAQDARATIDEMYNGIGGDMEKHRENMKNHLSNLKGFKIAYVAEVTAIKKELQDIRTFFVGAEHDREIARLREFVDLCERIAALKRAGTLDAVAETIIKLA